MTLDRKSLRLLDGAMARLDAGFAVLPAFDAEDGVDAGRLRGVLDDVARRLQDNFPYPHPLYAGQMLKPPHAVARLAYALAMAINPNNHALDGGRASSAMEKEAVAALAAMVGWDEHLGHLTGGGTMANLEALWVASRLHPGRRIVASEQAHYTHSRMCEVIGVDFEAVPVDARGRMDAGALEAIIARGGVGTVVVTLGTTGLGAVDPLAAVLELRERSGFRVHVDAAYGGYHALTDTLEPGTRAAYDALDRADSIVIDPHKHGLQPYGCGCVLFRDPSVGSIYKHDSPYTYFSSGDLHLGEISLECSRPGAAAVALWATQRMFPLDRGGEFARMLESCRRAATEFHGRLSGDARFLTVAPPELDIVVYAPRAECASEVSDRSRRLFDEAARRHLHLALMELPAPLARAHWSGVRFDQPGVRVLRSALMKPEHHAWLGEIWASLDAAVDVV